MSPCILLAAVSGVQMARLTTTRRLVIPVFSPGISSLTVIGIIAYHSFAASPTLFFAGNNLATMIQIRPEHVLAFGTNNTHISLIGLPFIISFFFFFFFFFFFLAFGSDRVVPSSLAGLCCSPTLSGTTLGAIIQCVTLTVFAEQRRGSGGSFSLGSLVALGSTSRDRDATSG